jgi:hypothetical protein
MSQHHKFRGGCKHDTLLEKKRPNHQLHSHGHGESSQEFDNNDDYGVQSSYKK